MKREVINQFKGNYAFLSNMFPCTVIYKGFVFNCTEAAFQSQKKPEMAQKFVGIDGYTARKLGRTIQMTTNEIVDWNKRKERVMYEVVWYKFHQNKELLEKLNETGEAVLVEQNTWNDYFWGVCDGKGCNILGNILAMNRKTTVRILTKEGVESKVFDYGFHIQRKLDEYYDPAYAVVNGRVLKNHACVVYEKEQEDIKTINAIKANVANMSIQEIAEELESLDCWTDTEPARLIDETMELAFKAHPETKCRMEYEMKKMDEQCCEAYGYHHCEKLVEIVVYDEHNEVVARIPINDL